ncbi:hypothetical protein LX36DRAFT_314137 [Colletotrichum falcatum]|nr:hypothetical protein LX36DRAFT_314137 [Colletotrichum falcatum]
MGQTDQSAEFEVLDVLYTTLYLWTTVLLPTYLTRRSFCIGRRDKMAGRLRGARYPLGREPLLFMASSPPSYDMSHYARAENPSGSTQGRSQSSLAGGEVGDSAICGVA